MALDDLLHPFDSAATYATQQGDPGATATPEVHATTTATASTPGLDVSVKPAGSSSGGTAVVVGVVGVALGLLFGYFAGKR